MATKRKAFFYKQATFIGDVNGTLQDLLKTALAKHKKPLKRRDNPSGDDLNFCFINYTGTHGKDGGPGNLLGGEFFSYTKGADQSALENMDEEVEEVNVSAFLPGDNKEFLEGSVYFGVLNNHVVLVQSTALRSVDLEKHLNWFLREKSKVIDDKCYVGLSDVTPRRNKAVFSEAKGLTLKAPVEFETKTVPTANKPGTTKKADSVIVTPKGRAWDALVAFFGDAIDLPAELDKNDILENNHLKVELVLHWEKTRKKDSSDFLADTAFKLRHITNEFDYSIDTTTGPITKDEFKLTQPYSVGWNEGRPMFDDLFPKMLEFLESLVEGGKLTL